MSERLLLDTHTVLWWLADEQLAGEAKALIADTPLVAVSTASVWEVGIKVALGKLRVEVPFAPVVRDAQFALLPVSGEHADAAAALPGHHWDPFDRMLIAQAVVEGLTIVTRDQRFSDYDVPIIEC